MEKEEDRKEKNESDIEEGSRFWLTEERKERRGEKGGDGGGEGRIYD